MPTPNFEDAPDGSSSVNHTGSTFSEENYGFWEDIDPWADIPSHPPQLRDPAPPSGPRTTVDFEITENPFLPSPPPPTTPQMTATQVAEAQRAARLIDTYNAAVRPAVPPNPNRRTEARMYSQGTAPHVSPPRRRSPRSPNDIVRKDPNAWTLREAVELCKLLEVVIPEAGFHIALTGGLLHKEGRQANCDLLFYQIRGVQPNYEILWKYLTVAGVIRLPEDSYNGFVVRATYRGKAVDCLFPNAKKVGAAKGDCYKAAPVLWDAAQTASTPAPIIYHRIPDDLEEFLASNDPAPVAPASRRESERIAAAIAADLGIASGIPAVERVTEARRPIIPILYRRTPSAPPPYDPAELLATPAPAPIPAVAQWEEPF